MKNKRLQHSLATKKVIQGLLKKERGKIKVNLRKNPHLKRWVKNHPRLEELK